MNAHTDTFHLDAVTGTLPAGPRFEDTSLKAAETGTALPDGERPSRDLLERVLDRLKRLTFDDEQWSESSRTIRRHADMRDRHDSDLDRTLALGRETLRVCADQPVRSVWQRATTLHGLTQRWANEPQVLEFSDQLRTWRDRPEVQAISGRTG